MARKLMALGSALLACLLVASPLTAEVPTTTSPRELLLVEGQWNWGSGSDRVADGEGFASYGTKGVAAPGNVPGVRRESLSWKDASGNFWLFGGYGRLREGETSGSFNDLWKWDGTNWTWVSGSNDRDQSGVYGTKGVAAPGNTPGAREGSVGWTDASGSFWLFGGNGFSASGRGGLNDLWKWNGTNWTWVSGTDWSNNGGTYGTKGVAAPGNLPGSRRGSVSWTDGSGNFWLFGGEGISTGVQFGYLNDLWKWDGASWTWVGGAREVYQPGTYGTKGTAAPGNVPGARHGTACWKDASGNTWLFGGQGMAAGGSGELNDLWKWDGTNWTWMGGSDLADQFGVYGTKGVAAPGNVPGARYGPVAWTDVGGTFWLHGGAGYSTGVRGLLNDLWKWDGANWTWVSGSDEGIPYGTYGTKGIPGPANVPGGRLDSVSWKDASGHLWLFGGAGYSANKLAHLNDLWKWDGTNWTWVSGSDGFVRFGAYGTKGAPAPGNVPGGRYSSVSWTDPSGGLWLFGGYGFAASASGYLNDLWKWDGTNWTWVSGSDQVDQSGAYGTKGVAAPGNVPGARAESVSWTDASGSLWLFGGVGPSESFGLEFNDLWKWDGTNWTWVSGSDQVNQSGVYGTKGVAASGNVPGGRHGSISWKDAAGAFWLFGGRGQSAYTSGHLNDLWKWDGANWTWVSGSDGQAQLGTYGTKGVPAPGNVPGARTGSVSWTDAGGNFWLFGGLGQGATYAWGYLNDLWKRDGTNWTWVSGADLPNQPGAYGTKGVAAPGNTPGGREGVVSWTSADGNLWLLGGFVRNGNSYGVTNDLWKWNGTSWTWMSGSDQTDQNGTYGTQGVAAPGNVPGARRGSVSWRDASGNLRLFGGHGFDSGGGRGYLNDLWAYGMPCSLSSPVAGNGGPYGIGATIRLRASLVAGATYSWTGPDGFISTDQNPTIPDATTAMGGVYGVEASVDGCTSAAGTTTVVVLHPQGLAIAKIGVGTGLVSSTPGGIDCGSTCAALFPGASQVTLTAAPDGSSRFAGWTGAGCTGTEPCTLTMDAAKSVSATFLSAGGVGFHTVTPCRIADTRNADGPWGGPAFEAGVARAFEIAGRCGVPADAAAVALNVTVTNPTSAGSLTVYPGTGVGPETSTVSFAAGRTRANNATIGLVGGFVTVLDRQENGTTNVIIDVSGYYR